MMQKEGETEKLEEEKPKAKYIWRNFLVTILIIILFAIAAWFLFKPWRTNYSRDLVSEAQKIMDQKSFDSSVEVYAEHSRSTQDKQAALNLYTARLITPWAFAPYFELGKLAYKNENWALAQKYFISALRRNGQKKEAYTYLINSLINQGKILEVNKYLEKLDVLDPNDPEIIFLKARLALNSDQKDKAKELLKTIKNRGLKYETYYALILLSEGKSAIIEKSSSTELNSLITEVKESQNQIFVKARLGLEWLKLQEKAIGCELIKEAKNIDQDTTQKLNTYQKLFNYCNL